MGSVLSRSGMTPPEFLSKVPKYLKQDFGFWNFVFREIKKNLVILLSLRYFLLPLWQWTILGLLLTCLIAFAIKKHFVDSINAEYTVLGVKVKNWSILIAAGLMAVERLLLKAG